MFLLAIAIAIPLGLDLYMPVPEDNPLTLEKIELGRRLFFDRRLSRDGSISCSSCNDPDRAFSDGRAMDAHIVNLRRKLGSESIASIRGMGYRFDG